MDSAGRCSGDKNKHGKRASAQKSRHWASHYAKFDHEYIVNRTIATRLSASRSSNVYVPYPPGVRFFRSSCTAENAATARQIKANMPSMMGEGATSVAFANGFASGAIASTSPMLINVIELQTTSVKTLKIGSMGDERHISEGTNASATTTYKMPKPTSTYFTRIAPPENPKSTSERWSGPYITSSR
jgi:hypothetical protein